MDFVRRWSEKTEIGVGRFIHWLGVTASKFYDWRQRYGGVNEHNGWVPRDFWLERWEKEAIIDFHMKNPLEGYRRLTFMMLDADVVAVSPASVWRVLKQAGLPSRWKTKPSRKGIGFEPIMTAPLRNNPCPKPAGGRSKALWLCTLIVIAFALPAMAQVNGAIYTTNSAGTSVNGNIYDAKTDVYLSGGPQNTKDKGLVPDGNYYFQVTDPSGAVLLSLDNVKCRVVVVSNGRVSGVPGDNAGGFGDPTCYHMPGTQNDSNGALPVQLCSNGLACDAPNSYKDTPNPGGEYKAWMTPVADYGEACAPNHGSFGFCDSDSKTDNFKVKKANVGLVTVCKFNDLNGTGTRDTGEPLIPFCPITAAGVDTLTGPIGTVSTQTDATGCVSFSVSNFTSNGGNVTLTEGLLTGWQQTAPPDGTYTVPDGNPNNTNGTVTVTVLNGVESFTVAAGDSVTAPYFGNTCLVDACGGNTIELTVTKDANPSLTRTFTWGITKDVDKTEIDTAPGGNTTFNYTVSVTHNSGTDSGWQVTGKIKVTNPSLIDITGVNVSDAVDNGGNCTLSGGTGITVPAKSEVDVPYTCTYGNLPASGTNTATAAWDSSSASGTASIDFTNAAINAVDGSVTVTDSLGGTLGTVSSTDPSPQTFTYSNTVSGTPGTCVTQNNTATFTTDTTSTTGSASKSGKVCEGADLVVSKTATATSVPKITKTVDSSRINTFSGGSATFNYTVIVTVSGWNVSGTITVSNPNDWEAVTVSAKLAANEGRIESRFNHEGGLVVSALESVGRRQAGVNWLRVAPNRGECRTALFILSCGLFRGPRSHRKRKKSPV